MDSVFLLGSVVLTLCLLLFYFVNYVKPDAYPASKGLGMTLKTAAQFLAIQFGPVAIRSWDLFIFLNFAFLLPTIFVVISADIYLKETERNRALVILLFLAISILYSLAIGNARSGIIAEWVFFPMWYMIFPIPFFSAMFFGWELFAKSQWQIIFQKSLFWLVCLLLPLNIMTGFTLFGNWYDHEMDSLEWDIEAKMSISQIAQRHNDLLIHWWDEKELADHIQMLCKDRMTSFTLLSQCQ